MQYVAADAVIGLYAAHGQGLDVSIVAMLMSPTGYCMGVSNENVGFADGRRRRASAAW